MRFVAGIDENLAAIRLELRDKRLFLGRQARAVQRQQFEIHVGLSGQRLDDAGIQEPAEDQRAAYRPRALAGENRTTDDQQRPQLGQHDTVGRCAAFTAG